MGVQGQNQRNGGLFMETGTSKGQGYKQEDREAQNGQRKSYCNNRHIQERTYVWGPVYWQRSVLDAVWFLPW